MPQQCKTCRLTLPTGTLARVAHTNTHTHLGSRPVKSRTYTEHAQCQRCFEYTVCEYEFEYEYTTFDYEYEYEYIL